jgi:hypothetical protein
MNHNPYAHGTEDDEVADYCTTHHETFWPSEGCYKCRAAQSRRDSIFNVAMELALSQENWWEQQDQDDEWIGDQL